MMQPRCGPRYLVAPACGRDASGPPFHHAVMVLPAQTRVKAACRRHCVMGCASLDRAPGPTDRLRYEEGPGGVCGMQVPGGRAPPLEGRAGVPPPCPLSSSGGGWLEVGLAVSEHGVEDVAASAGEGDQGFVDARLRRRSLVDDELYFAAKAKANSLDTNVSWGRA